MRYSWLVLLCLSCFSFGQTSQQLRSRYGQPDVERFIVRPNVRAAVEYGADGAACQVVIQPDRTLVPMEQPIKYLRPETVTAVLEEIVPVSGRGRKLGTLYENMGCAHGEEAEYENVVISRDTDQCVPLKPERESSATVAFKRSGCPPASLFSKESPSQKK